MQQPVAALTEVTPYPPLPTINRQTISVRAMLAVDAHNALSKLVFPLIASPKYDGVRCLVTSQGPVTRSLGAIPNNVIREALSDPALAGIDGELIVGPAARPETLDVTSPSVMSREGRSDFTLYAFDDFTVPEAPFSERLMRLGARALPVCVLRVEQRLIRSLQELLELEEKWLALGHEGVMLRDPKSPYKLGRSTIREQALLRLKREG